MANWCNNTVVFEGTDEAIEQITQLFKSMADKEQKEDCGQLPDFVQDTHGDYFYNISQDNESVGVFQYETKWSPNTQAVKVSTSAGLASEALLPPKKEASRAKSACRSAARIASTCIFTPLPLILHTSAFAPWPSAVPRISLTASHLPDASCSTMR